MSQTIYKEHLSEPWFSLVSLGLKTCEGRLYKNRFQTYKVGDIVMWFNDDFGKTRFVMTRITHINIKETFEDLLKDNFCGGLKNVLPGMPSVNYGIQVYQKYFTEEDEKKYGIVSFELKVLKYKVIQNNNVDPKVLQHLTIYDQHLISENVLGYCESIDECIDLCYEKNKDLIGGNKLDAYRNNIKNKIEKNNIDYSDVEHNNLKFNLFGSQEKPNFNCKIINLTNAESSDYYYHLLEYDFNVDEEDLKKDIDEFFNRELDVYEFEKINIEKCEQMERKRLNSIAWDILQHLPEEMEKNDENNAKDDSGVNVKNNQLIPSTYKNPALFTHLGRL